MLTPSTPAADEALTLSTDVLGTPSHFPDDALVHYTVTVSNPFGDIPGFVVSGSTGSPQATKKLLIRAVGPTLMNAPYNIASAMLVNISNRDFVGTGEAVMIPGFVISSGGSKTLLVRVIGPTLAGAPYNVPGTMADPKLTIFSGQTPFLENDDWGDNPDAANTASTAQSLGAFALTEGSKDAAFVVTLPPGGYTVVGSAADGISTGVVLVEVYVID